MTIATAGYPGRAAVRGWHSGCALSRERAEPAARFRPRNNFAGPAGRPDTGSDPTVTARGRLAADTAPPRVLLRRRHGRCWWGLCQANAGSGSMLWQVTCPG